MTKNKKNIIILTVLIIFFMLLAYARFSNGIIVNGTSNINSIWNVYFESIETKQKKGLASDKQAPTVEKLTANMNIKFEAPGDKIVYEVVLKNGGTLNAVVNDITVEKGGTPEIMYTIEGIQKGDKVLVGETRKITITVEFDENVTTMPQFKESIIKVEIECMQALNNVTSQNLVVYPPMLKEATNYYGTTQAFYEGPIKREEIESVAFTNTNKVPNGVMGSWDVSANNDYSVMAWYFDSDNNGLYEVVIGQDGGVIANPNSSCIFQYMTNLKSIDLTYFDTSNVTDMSYMFSYCQKLLSLNLSGFDTSKVRTMANMFSNCEMLLTLDLSNFDTSNLTNTYFMFAYCYKLKNIDLDSFNTSNVVNMDMMFIYCESLSKLNLNSFDTSKVTTLKYMFYYCSNLEELDLGNATFGSVMQDSGMFIGAYSDMTITVKSNTEKTWILDKLPTANVILA